MTFIHGDSGAAAAGCDAFDPFQESGRILRFHHEPSGTLQHLCCRGRIPGCSRGMGRERGGECEPLGGSGAALESILPAGKLKSLAEKILGPALVLSHREIGQPDEVGCAPGGIVDHIGGAEPLEEFRDPLGIAGLQLRAQERVGGVELRR